MSRTARLALCCTALVVAACAKKEAPKDTTAAMAPAAAPAPAPAPALAAADVAGNWHFAATPTTGKDTAATEYDIAAIITYHGGLFDTEPGKNLYEVIAHRKLYSYRR